LQPIDSTTRKMFEMNIIFALILGYLIGSFPSAFLLGKLRGQNIFAVGSGNMGAMNTARNLGYGLGILVLLLDLAKGALATYLGLTLFGIIPALVAGGASVLGHAWSIYIGFKGGKGLATALGVSLPLYPIGGLIALALLILLIAIFRKVNLASFMIAVLYPIINGVTGYWQKLSSNQILVIVLSTLVIASIVAIKHVPSLKKELGKV
jgi:acyl phosphate:glycerol-3-phosphate acyltransferase